MIDTPYEGILSCPEEIIKAVNSGSVMAEASKITATAIRYISVSFIWSLHM